MQAENYREELLRQLHAQNEVSAIIGLEQLFRRTTNGFNTIKQFVRELVSIQSSRLSSSPLLCRMDVFAYSFLKGAKNFDLLLPFDRKNNSAFLAQHKKWALQIEQLEKFERSGIKIDNDLSSTYLQLRQVVSRPSARDELRTLVTLLISGPSSVDEICQQLGLNSVLVGRMIAVFDQIQVIEPRGDETYALVEQTLSIVLFCLREVMGIELLGTLLEEH